MDLYYKSVGRGASFLLNVPPNRHGLIEDADVQSLKEFGRRLREIFGHNLAAAGKFNASNVRGSDRAFGASNLLSSNAKRYWSTDDGQNTPSVEIELKGEQTFNVIRVREPIQLGQRIESLAVDAWLGDAWKEVAKATSVGSCRLIKLSEPLQTRRVRLRVTKSPACPALYDFGLFLDRH